MVNQIKILQVLPELGSGGVERGTLEVAAAIVKSGNFAHVASAGGKMLDALSRTGAKHHLLPLASKNPFTMWMNSYKLIEIIRREKIQLVHARSRAPAWSAYFAAKATNTPFITTFHGVYNGYDNGLKNYYNSIMTRGQRVIAVSHFVEQHIKAHYHIEPTKITVIHRGADVEYFDPAKASGVRTMNLCKEWIVPDGLPLIMMPGRITRWKGQHVLIEALEKLPHRNFFCVLVGETGKHPAYVKSLNRQIEKANLQGHVRMVGTTQDMRAAYNAADIVVSASIEPEAFGRVPVEAQAMGKPVIGTAHGGACETISTGENGTGWLVPPNDSVAMSHALQEAFSLTDEDKIDYATHVRAKAIEHFSTQTMCDKTLAIYHEVLNAKL